MTDTKSIVLKGKAYWAHVRTPEKWDGEETGYSIMVQLESEEKLEKLKKYLSVFWDEHKSELDGKKLKAKADFLSPRTSRKWFKSTGKCNACHFIR